MSPRSSPSAASVQSTLSSAILRSLRGAKCDPVQIRTTGAASIISSGCLEILDHQAVWISDGDVPAGCDGSRRVEKLRAILRQPTHKFVERIDIKDRVDVTDKRQDFGAAGEDEETSDLCRDYARLSNTYAAFTRLVLEGFVKGNRLLQGFVAHIKPKHGLQDFHGAFSLALRGLSQDGSTTMHSRPPAVAAASIGLGRASSRKERARMALMSRSPARDKSMRRMNVSCGYMKCPRISRLFSITSR